MKRSVVKLWLECQEEKREVAKGAGREGPRCISVEEEHILWKERSSRMNRGKQDKISRGEFRVWRARMKKRMKG